MSSRARPVVKTGSRASPNFCTIAIGRSSSSTLDQLSPGGRDREPRGAQLLEPGLTPHFDPANDPAVKITKLSVVACAAPAQPPRKLKPCCVNFLGSVVALVILAAAQASAQETPRELVASYASLADTILAAKRTEALLVRSLLAGHRHGAEAYFRADQFEKAAAEIALFANEGDNAVAGVRKRLIDGGHHHNAEGEKEGIFEAGYVVVTKAAKAKALAASAALRRAKSPEERSKAFDEFEAVAKSLLDRQ